MTSGSKRVPWDETVPPLAHRAHNGLRADRAWCSVVLCLGGVLLLAGLSGCAHSPPSEAEPPAAATRANPDPLEPWNRGVFGFNDALDRAILKPTATAYQDYVPPLVRKGVGNFFNNLEDAWTTINSTLQLKGRAAGESFTRLWVNTFFGLGGLLDVATEMRIPRHKEDFGQTLGYWGVGAGPYLVLPLLGPSTLRDTAALPVDWAGDPLSQQDDVRLRNSLFVLGQVDNRAGLLKQEALMEGATFDRYVLIRDAYLQYRRHLVYDGDPPDEPMPAEEDYSAEDYQETAAPETTASPDSAASSETEKSLAEDSADPTEPQVERDTRVPGRIPGTPTVPLDLGLPGLKIIK
ncbi:VacJ family lipoprotein [Hylemonella sp. W303a]|uniref:MlaA family lipoprotein n=1 Tax=Hylemonella sp. W303a TaxID=3389873 RepID=UPI00396B2467